MIFIIVFSASEYESTSRCKTDSKSTHMITCENPNNAECEITQIASSADENKYSGKDQIDSENKSAVIQYTKNKDQSQITGMYHDWWLKVDINIYSHPVFTLYNDEILTTSLQQIIPLHSSRAYRFKTSYI